MADNLKEYDEMKKGLFEEFQRCKNINSNNRAERLSELSEAYVKVSADQRIAEKAQPKNVTKVDMTK